MNRILPSRTPCPRRQREQSLHDLVGLRVDTLQPVGIYQSDDHNPSIKEPPAIANRKTKLYAEEDGEEDLKCKVTAFYGWSGSKWYDLSHS